ncbi:VWA domain-containing protein [Desulfobulbus alkaliphilus]|uniref:VWA domain-containing protein n=1 Tax=Desulfobulbus alkaliphilus TaxID=869814 RepID=UPI001963BCC9|nr:VWA domain-containing protein [Desulfobulbus alkaliphilus]
MAPSLPNEWDVEEALASLSAGQDDQVDDILAQVPAIWPVSHSLCFAYLAAVGPALRHLDTGELSLWVHTLLDRYETGGLRGAQLFMADVEQHFFRQMRGQGGLRAVDVFSRLQPYVNGLAGREMPLVAASLAATDTECIFVPDVLDLFVDNEQNFLLYKLTVSFQWASTVMGTLTAPPTVPAGDALTHPLEQFFSSFSCPSRARSLYHFFETGRMLTFLADELPGLMREAAALLPRLPLAEDAAEAVSLLDLLQRGLLRDNWPIRGTDRVVDRAVDLVRHSQSRDADNQDSIEAVKELIPQLEDENDWTGTTPLVFQGTLRLQDAWLALIRQRQERENRFIKALTAHIEHHRAMVPADAEEPEGGQNQSSQQGQDLALIVDTDKQAQRQAPPAPSLRIDNEDILLNEELAQLAAEIRRDLGTMPEEYISSAVGRAGHGFALRQATEADAGQESMGPAVYDEWDYRRKGFRKNWCVVKEKEIPQVQNTFIEQTLHQYRGQIRRLRHQFEMMRTSERFVRRQREGSDIDFDALVESLADMRAGRPSSDRLFIRLARDQRDIAVYFLVDMSNSTSGWVGQAIKEALVLICEAMEPLNDRYGIYGFSGMRRLRCEVYPVKRLDERYSPQVRQRIGAMGPREYTRMAPAIRHMTSVFADVEAKIRLLIVLSDGKPEDYDEYKGEYAIEDTRHALLEAKARGVHPFCITIDRTAHEYMAHMYGAVNYIFVDEISRLPARMPEIYRTLTT